MERFIKDMSFSLGEKWLFAAGWSPQWSVAETRPPAQLPRRFLSTAKNIADVHVGMSIVES
jgi:hypothetical protein